MTGWSSDPDTSYVQEMTPGDRGEGLSQRSDQIRIHEIVRTPIEDRVDRSSLDCLFPSPREAGC